MKLRYVLKNIPREANVLAFASLVLLLCKYYLFDEVAEIFPGAHKAGLIFESLLASMMSGYIFYFFVEQIKESKEVKIVSPFIVKKAKLVAGQASAQLAEFSKKGIIELSLENFSIENINETLKKIVPLSKAPLVIDRRGTYAHWLQFLEYYKIRSLEAITKLQNQINYLSPEMSRSIAEIEDCTFFLMLRAMQEHSYSVNNPDMTIFSEPFYKYCLLCRELLAHAEEYERKFAA
jgi:hypothetical protein